MIARKRYAMPFLTKGEQQPSDWHRIERMTERVRGKSGKKDVQAKTREKHRRFSYCMTD